MESLKTQVRRRWEDLKTERSSWMPHWREISEDAPSSFGIGFLPCRKQQWANGMPTSDNWTTPCT